MEQTIINWAFAALGDAINWGCFVIAVISYKLWCNRATVTTDTYGTTNLRSGVVG